MFISIHANASDKNPNARGAEIYVHRDDDSNSRALSNALASSLNGKSLEAGFAVLSDNSGLKSSGKKVQHRKIPAVLVETGYLSNAEERKMLASEEGQQEIAMKIAQGIARYMQDNNVTMTADAGSGSASGTPQVNGLRKRT